MMVALMSEYWKLDGHNVVPASDLMDSVRSFESRHVDQTMIGDVRISTVFLGIDHSHGMGPPLLFETMIFGGKHDQYQGRCSTWEQAEKMHSDACQLVRSSLQ